MPITRKVFLFLGCMFALSCKEAHKPIAQTAPNPSPESDVQRKSSPLGTEFVIEKDGCRIRWTALINEPGVIRCRSECSVPLSDQTQLIRELLKSIQGETTIAIRTLDWGRLCPDGPKDVTMPARLAAAAKKSSDWNSVYGKARSPDINGVVRKIADEAMIYRELSTAFQETGLVIKLASVEKVLVAPAAELPFYGLLKNQGVNPKDRLPYDFQTWFSVRPMPGRPTGSR